MFGWGAWPSRIDPRVLSRGTLKAKAAGCKLGIEAPDDPTTCFYCGLPMDDHVTETRDRDAAGC